MHRVQSNFYFEQLISLKSNMNIYYYVNWGNIPKYFFWIIIFV